MYKKGKRNMITTIVVIDKKGFAEHYDVECQILVPNVLRVFREHCTSDTKLMAMVCSDSHYMFECRPLTNVYWQLTVSSNRNCHQTPVCKFKM